METSHSAPRSNVARTMVLLAGLFFFVCAALYNHWLLMRVVEVVHRALHRPWTRVPDSAVVLRMELVYLALSALFTGSAVLIGTRGRLDRFFRKPVVASLVLAFLAVFVPVATLEVALRPYTPWEEKSTSLFVKDREMGWRLRPSTTQPWGDVMVTTNAKGLRGPEVPYERTPGALRVLYLGDSVTFGYLVARWQDAFPFVADSLLSREIGAPVETVNAGVGGYSPWQELAYLRKEGLRYEPDVVVLNFVLNDVTEKFTLVRYGGYEESRQLRDSYYSRLDEILSRSALAYQVKNFAREWKAKRVLGADPQLGAIKKEIFDVDALMHRPDADYIQGAWKITLESVQGIIDACREHDVPLLLVVHPFRVQLDSPEELSAPQRRLLSYAADQHVRAVDLLPILHSHLDDTNSFHGAIYLDHDHYSPDGHRLVAAVIADSLSALVSKR